MLSSKNLPCRGISPARAPGAFLSTSGESQGSCRQASVRGVRVHGVRS